jgi:hypothetical protein
MAAPVTTSFMAASTATRFREMPVMIVFMAAPALMF